MSLGTTNIDDLPNNSNIKIDVKEDQQTQQTPNQIPQLSNDDLNKIISGIQSASNNNMTSLPSRDIPVTQEQFTQDEQIQPNYIPEQKTQQNDYIENDNTIDDLVRNNQKKQINNKKTTDLQEELQTPILIIILFFLFQLPIINKQLFTYLPSLFIKDGNMNFIGYLVKSLLFGGVYYGIIKFLNYIE
jgi:hypothetical protein